MTVSTDAVIAARAGDTAALERLLAAAWPSAFRLALGIVRDPVTAEDVAQDALVRIAGGLAALRDPATFPLWSKRVVVNSARSALRERARDVRRNAADQREERGAAAFEDAIVRRLDVLRALQTLPLWLRVPLVLHYADGLSSREIGTVLGSPAATVRFRLALARRRLAAALDPAAATVEEFA